MNRIGSPRFWLFPALRDSILPESCATKSECWDARPLPPKSYRITAHPTLRNMDPRIRVFATPACRFLRRSQP